MVRLPYVPEFITVHPGRPSSSVPDITLSFPDYIKNVASSEIYPTWPEDSLIANILAQISFALNRVYTEWYRSRGYSFDITSSTAYDQAFVYGRDIFSNISDIVDDIFNHYIRRQGFIEPLAASFCSGTTATCNGLSQWGSVTLAERGYTSMEILRHYYGDNIEQVEDAPIAPYVPSYPGAPLSEGSSGRAVYEMQYKLNRIALNWPLIPLIDPVDGIFGSATKASVMAFQEIFGLARDGIIGKQTWYQVIYLYAAVKQLAELESEGETLWGMDASYPGALQLGDEGRKVLVLQHWLWTISLFDARIPPGPVDGVFMEKTHQQVRSFQAISGREPNGRVTDRDWELIYRQVSGILKTIPRLLPRMPRVSSLGQTLVPGDTGELVLKLQSMLMAANRLRQDAPPLAPTGLYDEAVEQNVRLFRLHEGMEPDGHCDHQTWNALGEAYRGIFAVRARRLGQYPGMAPAMDMLDPARIGG
nr:peptidoglycan-binding protein [bacterium]